MTTEHDERYARWLQRVLDEGLDPSSAEAREMTQDRIEFEDEVEGARHVVALLERSAEAQREELAESDVLEDARSREIVRSFLEEQSASGERARGPRPLNRMAWPLAAAAALVLFWMGWSQRTPEFAPGEIRMGSAIRLEAPTFDGDGLPLLAWDYELSAGGWFNLIVRDPSQLGEASVLARVEHLSGSSWSPSVEQFAGWPAEVTWELLAFDGTGGVEASVIETLKH